MNVQQGFHLSFFIDKGIDNISNLMSRIMFYKNRQVIELFREIVVHLVVIE